MCEPSPTTRGDVPCMAMISDEMFTLSTVNDTRSPWLHSRPSFLFGISDPTMLTDAVNMPRTRTERTESPRLATVPTVHHAGARAVSDGRGRRRRGLSCPTEFGALLRAEDEGIELNLHGNVGRVVHDKPVWVDEPYVGIRQWDPIHQGHVPTRAHARV